MLEEKYQTFEKNGSLLVEMVCNWHIKPLSYNENVIISVVGASGLVGRKLLQIIEQSNWNIEKLHTFSRREAAISFKNKIIKTKPISANLIQTSDIVFNCATSCIAKELECMLGPNTYLIDKSSAFRHIHPLIVPGINHNAIKKSKIIASPNCVAIPLAMCLHPILELCDIELCVINTYQSVSGAGTNGLKALSREQKDIDLNITQDEQTPSTFSTKIAQNVIPLVGQSLENLWSDEEEKIAFETCKILDKQFIINANCARVGVPIGHSAFVTLMLDKQIELNTIIKQMEKKTGLFILNENNRYITPRQVNGYDGCFVSRMRFHPQNNKLLSFWFTCDNLRTGAAGNAFLIAQIIKDNLKQTNKK